MSPATIILTRAPNDGFYASPAILADTILIVEFAGRALGPGTSASAQLIASMNRTAETGDNSTAATDLRAGLPSVGARALVANDTPEATAAIRAASARLGWRALGPCSEFEAAEYRHDLNADRRPGQTPKPHPAPLPAPDF